MSKVITSRNVEILLIFGVYIGIIESVFIIYIYHVWIFKANIIYNKLQFFYIFGNIVFVLLVLIIDGTNKHGNTDYILSQYQYIWYFVLFVAAMSVVLNYLNDTTDAIIYELVAVNFNLHRCIDIYPTKPLINRVSITYKNNKTNHTNNNCKVAQRNNIITTTYK